VALELNRLIRNLANLKNKETAKNKFLKTKPKIQEMKQNVEKAREEAAAFHDYVQAAEVQMGGPGGAGSIPPFELDSFKPLMDMLVDVFTGSKTQSEQLSLVAALQDKLEIGIAVTNAGQRYLTTRARALEIGATFQPMNNSLAASLSQGGGTIK
jgi:hypothetical protein